MGSQNVDANICNGVPCNYTKTGSNSKTITLSRGQLNKFKLRPQIINEHQESSRNVQGTVTSTNIVGQVFKASHDNINGIMTTMETAATTEFDTFETYADDAALQAAWAGAGRLATLDITTPKVGTKAMQFPITNVGDVWVKTVTATDYNDYSFAFFFKQNFLFGVAEVEFYIGDGTNTKSITLPVSGANSWQQFSIQETAMTDDGVTTPNMAAITKIGFRTAVKIVGGIGYVDEILTSPEPGSVEFKLWKFGPTIPVSEVTALDDAVQYTELGDRGFNGGTVHTSINVKLYPGKRIYNIVDFVAGVALEIPGNTTLVKDNYYMLTIHYVDTNTKIYGADETYGIDYYQNGFAFTTPDESTAITTVGDYCDLMFVIHSAEDVYIYETEKDYNGAPGALASEVVYIEDKNMKIIGTIEGANIPLQSHILDLRQRPVFLPKGGKYEIYYYDDASDLITTLNGTIFYMYKEQSVNN
jgi:hypothetical protein